MAFGLFVYVYILLESNIESNIDDVVAMQRDCVWSEKYKIKVFFAEQNIT